MLMLSWVLGGKDSLAAMVALLRQTWNEMPPEKQHEMPTWLPGSKENGLRAIKLTMQHHSSCM